MIYLSAVIGESLGRATDQNVEIARHHPFLSPFLLFPLTGIFVINPTLTSAACDI